MRCASRIKLIETVSGGGYCSGWQYSVPIALLVDHLLIAAVASYGSYYCERAIVLQYHHGGVPPSSDNMDSSIDLKDRG